MFQNDNISCLLSGKKKSALWKQWASSSYEIKYFLHLNISHSHFLLFINARMNMSNGFGNARVIQCATANNTFCSHSISNCGLIDSSVQMLSHRLIHTTWAAILQKCHLLNLCKILNCCINSMASLWYDLNVSSGMSDSSSCKSWSAEGPQIVDILDATYSRGLENIILRYYWSIARLFAEIRYPNERKVYVNEDYL